MSTTTQTRFETLKEILTAIRSLSESDFNTFTDLRDYFRDNEEETKVIIGRETVATLQKYCFRKENKGYLVRSLYDSILSSFNFADMLQVDVMNKETHTQALIKVFEGQTVEQFEAWKAKKQEARAALKKAIENPETLAEFSTFCQYKGEKALTTEQRERLDDLKAGRTREVKEKEQERKNEIAAVTLQGVDMVLKESKHTKKNIPLWVVVLSSRVDRDTYTELNNKAKRLGGYYSSYSKDGAIPGFTFENEEGAVLFMELKNRNVNKTDLVKAEQEEKALTRVEQLRQKADKLEDEATEELNRERKDNTHRRATMAAHAEQRATSQIHFAKTLRKIAEAMEAGEIKYLDRLANMTELGDLQMVLNCATSDYIREKNIKRDNFEMCPEVIDFVKFPYPTIWKENGLKIAYHAKTVRGRVLAANRIGKSIFKSKTDLYTVSPYDLEDFQTVFCSPYKTSSYEFTKWEAERYINDLQTLNRFKRLNITTIEELRAALRELLRIKEGVSLDPEQKRAQELKELERQFVGKKIEGFFPTPEGLAAEVVELAEIQDGEIVLEPSAGLGHLAEVIRTEHPNAVLQCVEQYHPLAEALKVKGFTVEFGDFLAFDGKFDKIVMNPPFENLQDIDHVLHAFELLKPGGRLVAIMANNKQGDREKVKNFLALVDMFGEMRTNDPDAFRSSFRPTGVSTVTVILNKPQE